jgi:hypothetical protein
MVNETVEHYLPEQQRAKLDREVLAYEAMHSVRRKFYGEKTKATITSLSQFGQKSPRFLLILKVRPPENINHQSFFIPYKVMPYRVQEHRPKNKNVAIEVDGQPKVKY